MKTVIAYATKSGATRECAQLLAAGIADCSIWDLSKRIPNIEEADIVIIGSGIRMGKLYKPVRKFIDNNLAALLKKNTSFYLCNAYPDTMQKAIQNSIPEILAKKAVFIESFGGIPPFTSPKNQDWIRMAQVNALVRAVTSMW